MVPLVLLARRGEMFVGFLALGLTFPNGLTGEPSHDGSGYCGRCRRDGSDGVPVSGNHRPFGNLRDDEEIHDVP